MRLILTLLLLPTIASCALVQKPEIIPPAPRFPAEQFNTTPWPVVPLLNARTLEEKLAVVHELGEPTQAEAACRLYTVGRQLSALEMVIGELGPAPYGCALEP